MSEVFYAQEVGSRQYGRYVEDVILATRPDKPSWGYKNTYLVEVKKTPGKVMLLLRRTDGYEFSESLKNGDRVHLGSKFAGYR